MVKIFSNPFKKENGNEIIFCLFFLKRLNFTNTFITQRYVIETQMNFSCKNDLDFVGRILEPRDLNFRILRCQFSLYLEGNCVIMNFKFRPNFVILGLGTLRI